MSVPDVLRHTPDILEREIFLALNAAQIHTFLVIFKFSHYATSTQFPLPLEGARLSPHFCTAPDHIRCHFRFPSYRTGLYIVMKLTKQQPHIIYPIYMTTSCRVNTHQVFCPKSYFYCTTDIRKKNHHLHCH